MKRIHITLILIFFIGVQTFAQKKRTTTYQVNYKVIYRLDSLHPENTGSSTLYLYTSPDFGVFTNSNVIARRKALERMKNKYGPDVDFEYSENSRNPSFNRTFYKNLQTGKIITKAKLAKKDYVFKEPKKFAAWQIKDSTKTVKNYPVQKATTSFAGRDYVAWFTLEIPIPDGPYIFSGLPGLIVELYDTADDYHFKLKDVTKMEVPQTWTIPGNTDLSKIKFRRLQKKFHKNAKMNTDMGYIMSNTPGMEGSITTNGKGEVTSSDLTYKGKKVSKNEMRQIYKKTIDSQNNPIELE